MKTLIAWIRSKNWTTRTVVSAAGSLALFIALNPSLQEWIKTSFAGHPQLASLIVLVCVAWAKQSHSSSPAGTMAAARSVSGTVTSAEVDAADTKAQ